MTNHLIEGDALAPSSTDLVAQTRSLPVGERVPEGWRVLSGNLTESTIARVCFRYEAEEESETPAYCVDGLESDDPDSPYAGDGCFPPFRVFHPESQAYLPGTYGTREEAQTVADWIMETSRK